MIATKTRGKTEAGFTLLELLIVTTILGLILVALTSGVRFAGQAWEIQERHSNRQGDIDAVVGLQHFNASGTGFQYQSLAGNAERCEASQRMLA